MSKLRRAVIFVAAIVVTVAVAYILGVAAAGIVQKAREKKNRIAQTRVLLEKMGSGLDIGVTLPDAHLEDMNGALVDLSEILCERSMVGFVSTSCGFCKLEVERFNKLATDPKRQSCLILISDAPPADLLDFRNELNIQCQLYYDPDGTYQSALGVYTFPFNLIVDENRTIQDIIPGTPDEEVIEEIIVYKR
jgi:peroxiredoxin